MKNLSLLMVAFACMVMVGCSGRERCACPGCDREGTKSETYGDDLARAEHGGARFGQKKTVWFCPEHYDKRPGTWPGEFLKVGKNEQHRIDQKKHEAQEEAEKKAQVAAKAAWEQAFPENHLERSGENLSFKPRFTRQPRPGTAIGFVYSQPGGPALDEAKLKLGPIHFANAAHLDKGAQHRLDGLRVTVVVPLHSPIVDRQLVTFQQPELSVELASNGLGAPMGDGPPGQKLPDRETATIPPDQITGAIAEFERGPNELRLIGFLTPVCVAQRPKSP